MTVQDELYIEVKPDIDAVTIPLFDFSEQCLRKRNNFLPHAAILTLDDKVELIGAVSDSNDDYANSLQVLPVLHQGIRELVKKKEIKAIGIAENVTISPTSLPATHAIKILFEHKLGLTVALYLPFSKKFLRGYSFGDFIAIKANAEVNPWV